MSERPLFSRLNLRNLYLSFSALAIGMMLTGCGGSEGVSPGSTPIPDDWNPNTCLDDGLLTRGDWLDVTGVRPENLFPNSINNDARELTVYGYGFGSANEVAVVKNGSCDLHVITGGERFYGEGENAIVVDLGQAGLGDLSEFRAYAVVVTKGDNGVEYEVSSNFKPFYLRPGDGSDSATATPVFEQATTNTTFACNPNNGWCVDYYPNPDLMGLPQYQEASSNGLSFSQSWGENSPSPTIPADNFSSRWTRTTTFQPGYYCFEFDSDDGVRFSVDGQLLVNYGWGGPMRTVVCSNMKGTQTLTIEHQNVDDSAFLSFTATRRGDLL